MTRIHKKKIYQEFIKRIKCKNTYQDYTKGIYHTIIYVEYIYNKYFKNLFFKFRGRRQNYGAGLQKKPIRINKVIDMSGRGEPKEGHSNI